MKTKRVAWLTVLLVAAVAASYCLGCCHSVKHGSIYKSSDAQARCDAFYDLFSPDGVVNYEDNTKLRRLLGASTRQIHELLGEPTLIRTLNYKGVQWITVDYDFFDTCPSAAWPRMREAWQKYGWHFAPQLVFRNGVVVSHETMKVELEYFYQGPPEHWRFKEGGVFP